MDWRPRALSRGRVFGPTGAILASVSVGFTGACASQEAPTGGPQDLRPPVIVRTDPDTFGSLENLGDQVSFHFDERISERAAGGDLENAVSVSPNTGDIRVHLGRSSIRVEIEGGFRPGLVYRVTLLPVLSDLFGNQLRDPFELVFSTGGEPSPTTLAGEVWDRITGRGMERVTVRAVGEDSLVHLAQTDANGIFAFRYLPSGTFGLTAFEDLDQDGAVGSNEAQGSIETRIEVLDTLLVDIPVLTPDTTPAIATSAEVLDSVTIFIEFDDFLDPEASVDQIGLIITQPEGTPPAITRLFHEHEYRNYIALTNDSLARLDSLDAAEREASGTDTLPSDSLIQDSLIATAVDTGASSPLMMTREGPPSLPGEGQPSVAGRLLPGRRVVGQLDSPLEAGREYQAATSFVVNMSGIMGGGGDVVVLLESPVSDTVNVEPDSSSIAPDSVVSR